MEDIKAKGEIIRDIKDKIQFLVTIQIFFAAIVYQFFKVIGNDDIISNKQALAWGIGVAACIVNYLLVGTIDELKAYLLKVIRFLISLNLLFFILPLILLVILPQGPVPGYYRWPFLVCFYGTLVMPLITFLLIALAIDWHMVGEFARFLKRKINF